MSKSSEAHIAAMNEAGTTEAIVLREPLDIFAQFDRLDDVAIVDEMEGRLVDSAVYHFNQQGKELWGLAKTGVDWCATELSKKGYILRDEELNYSQDPTDPTYILFTAKVGKYFVDKTGAEAKVDSTFGTKRQWTKMARRDGTTAVDPFWFEKGSQKAIRNARMRLIPEETKAAIISLAKSGGRVREVKQEELGGQGARPSGGRSGDEKSSPLPAPAQPTSPAPSKKTFWTGMVTLETVNGPKLCKCTDAHHEFGLLGKALGKDVYRAVLEGICPDYHKFDDIPRDMVPEIYETLRLKLGDAEGPSFDPSEFVGDGDRGK